MSEIWPLLLIVGYISTLIFSSIKQKTQLREEIKFFGWYLVIGLISALWAHDRYYSEMYPPCDDCDSVDVNIIGMFRKLWFLIVLPYLEAFAAMSLIRTSILTAIYAFKRRSQISTN
jgi:hypothetical protein